MFPATDDLQLHFVRTDFSDDRRWAEVLSEVSSQYGMFRADILPVDDRHWRLGPGTRKAWTQPGLAGEFADLLAWRDRVYDQHRKKRA